MEKNISFNYRSQYINYNLSISMISICTSQCQCWRTDYWSGGTNGHIEEEQKTQWPIEKFQKNKQRSTKHIHTTTDLITRIPLKTWCELICSRRVSSSCSTSDTRRVNPGTNPAISNGWGKNLEVFTTSGTYLWSFVPQIFHYGQPSHGGDRKTLQVMTST
jgi:hypothetical protein